MKKKSLLLMLVIFTWHAVLTEASQLSDVFQMVKPSVVVIQTVQTDVSPDPNEKFISKSGLGSGVIISKDGKVLTAAHVVQTADAVVIHTQDKQLIPATVISSAPFADVALIQLEKMPDHAVAAEMADSDKMQVGDSIFVVGAPYGFTDSLSSGLISARQTYQIMKNAPEVALFQTDAAVNSGNSGGPMFNMDGKVIGIVSHIISRSGGFEGLGFAVTSNVAKEFLLEKNFFWTGARGILLTGNMAKVLNIPQPCGFLLQRVADNSPGSRMGFKGSNIPAIIDGNEFLVGGDIILEVAGDLVDGNYLKQDMFQKMIRNLKSGESVPIKLLRAGTVMELKFEK